MSIGSFEKRVKNRDGPIRILVTGGSQGSMIINKIIPEMISIIDNDVLVWHQTGKKYKKMTKKIYNDFNIIKYVYKLNGFIKDIFLAYKWADVIICRSGALTVSEIIYVGLPAIFIPFQHKDQHQHKNVIYLNKKGLANILKESELSAKSLKRKLYKLLSRKKLIKISKGIKKLPSIDSFKKIEKFLLQSIKNN